jgi:hypothetical protein
VKPRATPLRALAIVAAALALALLAGGAARAQTSELETSASASASASTSASASASASIARPPVPQGLTPGRELPDYDGRPGPPTTVGDVAIWVPRILFFPPYLVSEYVLRKPLGWFIATAERKKWPFALMDFFLTSDRKAGVIPTAFVDFGFKPSVGLYGFADDFLVARNDLRVHAGTWGPKYLNLGVLDRVRMRGGGTVGFGVTFVHRPDATFYGLGPRSSQDARSRYTHQVLDAGVEYTIPLGAWMSFRARSGFRSAKFETEGYCCGDPSLAARIADGTLTIPPGFDGYRIGYESLLLAFDTRHKRPAPESGLRLELAGEDAQQPSAERRNWIRWGAIGGAYLDLGRARTVALKTHVRFSDPLRGPDVPFNELVVLGGPHAMRGFGAGRLVDRSGIVFELEYRWPVWVWLDGTMHAALGNVFGPHLEGFETKLLRLSSGIGLRTNGSPDHAFEILTGFGTDTIADGMHVTSFRFVIGGTRGF